MAWKSQSAAILGASATMWYADLALVQGDKNEMSRD